MSGKLAAAILFATLFQFSLNAQTNLLSVGEGGNPNNDVFHVNAQAGENALRVQTDGTTRLRVFENGAVSIGSNWGTPLAEGLYIKGNTGIGTVPSDGTTRLSVEGNTSFSNDSNDNSVFLSTIGVPIFFNGSFMTMTNVANEQTVRIYSDVLGQGAGVIQLFDSDEATDTKIELNCNFENSGDARIITDELEIKGGSDLSENFDVTLKENENVEAGMLVSIDPDNPGKLIISEEAYDKRLAGIISGANGIKPGMMMGQSGSVADGAYPVALSGRVYVRADASFGKIAAGDLLTSSPTPGHAMKVKKRRKSQGAVIGKAMTSLTEGKGYVLVLVNLQ